MCAVLFKCSELHVFDTCGGVIIDVTVARLGKIKLVSTVYS